MSNSTSNNKSLAFSITNILNNSKQQQKNEQNSNYDENDEEVNCLLNSKKIEKSKDSRSSSSCFNTNGEDEKDFDDDNDDGEDNEKNDDDDDDVEKQFFNEYDNDEQSIDYEDGHTDEHEEKQHLLQSDSFANKELLMNFLSTTGLGTQPNLLEAQTNPFLWALQNVNMVGVLFFNI